MRIAHTSGTCGAGIRNSALLVSGNPNNYKTMVMWGVSLIPDLWRISNTCFLLLNSFLLSWLQQWTDFVFFLVGSCQLCSALIFALDSAKYVHYRAVLPILHRQETLSRHPHVMHVLVTPEFISVRANWHSKHDLKLTFLSTTNMYVHMQILRIDPSFRALH